MAGIFMEAVSAIARLIPVLAAQRATAAPRYFPSNLPVSNWEIRDKEPLQSEPPYRSSRHALRPVLVYHKPQSSEVEAYGSHACRECEKNSRDRDDCVRCKSDKEWSMNKIGYRGPEEKREAMFTTNGIVPGYIYNVGTRKYMVRSPEGQKKVLFASKEQQSPTILGAYLCYISDKGTSMHIQYISAEDYAYKRYTSTKSYHGSQGYVGVASESDGKEGKELRFLGANGGTDATDRFSFSLPYYSNERGVKMMNFDLCMGVNSNNALEFQKCAEDNNGVPSEKNDRQLFIWCPVHNTKICEEGFTR